MPLRSLSPVGEVLAFRHDKLGWEALRKKNRLENHLKMPCCGAAVVLKESRLGTRFFAHRRRGACTTAAESAEHLLVKDIVAQAAVEAGWHAVTEARGTSPDGRDWVADILCSREAQERSVAFEVQWTRQTLTDTEERQRRYRESGVRTLWLMRQSDVPISEELPVFTVRLGECAKPEVLMPSGHWPPNDLLHLFGRAEPRWGQRIPLEMFVVGALRGRLSFAPATGKRVPAEATGAVSECWKCGKPTCLLLGFNLLLERVYSGFGNAHITLAEIGGNPERGARWVAGYFPQEKLKSVGVGAVKVRYSRTAGERYLSNGCVHCGALQGRFFEHEVAFESIPLLEAVVLVEPWMTEESQSPSTLRRWWFDQEMQTGE